MEVQEEGYEQRTIHDFKPEITFKRWNDARVKTPTREGEEKGRGVGEEGKEVKKERREGRRRRGTNQQFDTVG